MYVHRENKDYCSAYILECLGSLSRCFSKLGDLGLICSVVLAVRVLMRTMKIGVFPWTMLRLGCFNELVCLDRVL